MEDFQNLAVILMLASPLPSVPYLSQSKRDDVRKPRRIIRDSRFEIRDSISEIRNSISKTTNQEKAFKLRIFNAQ